MAAREHLIPHITPQTCSHDSEPLLQHPGLTRLEIRFTLATTEPPSQRAPAAEQEESDIGFLTLYTLSLPHTPDLWTACHAYDAAHPPAAKLHKIDNFLGGECFFPDKQALIDTAECVVYVERAFLRPRFRGRGRGLRMVEVALKALGLVGRKGVVLLEPGTVVVPGEKVVEREDEDALEHGTEKLAAYWKHMGFAAWSYTDEAWLCLWTVEVGRNEQGEKSLAAKQYNAAREPAGL